MRRDPVRQLLAAYPVLHHALRQRVVDDGAGGQLSVHQATALSHLDRVHASTLSDLARAMGVALPTMSLLVDRLAKAGMVRRERDDDDRRRVALRLTPAGERAARTKALIDPDRVRLLLASMAPADRSSSIAGVVSLAQAARRLGPVPNSPGTPRKRKGIG
ncbi:MAG: winged helix-turn-helix transcriptional regulator [Gemmatimonadetes bacterium]|nr:winged helix-turn-helix transcriptional regulator [Gemmatimonadota bacterium]